MGGMSIWEFGNCLDTFFDYQGAEICERDKQRAPHPGPDHLVTMVYAQNQTQALQKIKQIRLEKGLPTK